MRTRLLVVLAVLGAIVVTAFAVPLALSTAEARTREFVAGRQAHLQRFAGLAEDYVRTGAEGLVQEEMDAYHELYAEGVAVVSTRGTGSFSTGAAPDDTRVADAVNSVLRNQRPSTPDVLTPWGAESVVFAQSVGTGTQVNGAVVIVASTEQARADIGVRWLLIGLGMVAALVLFGVLAVAVSGWVLRPLDRLSHRIRTLADTLPFAPPPEPGGPGSDGREETGPPELRALSRSFGTMASAVEHAVEAQRRLIADTAHQLRNPLAALQLRLDTLAPLVPPRGRAGFERAVSESQRLQGLLQDLLALSSAELPRDSSGAGRRCLPSLVAADRVDFWFDTAQRAGVTLVAPEVDTASWAAASAEDLQQILDVLLDNVCRYAGRGATATVRIHRHDDPSFPTPGITVEVADDGAGVAAEDLDRLTERFFRGTARTAEQGPAPSGTGLGLAIVDALVTANSGRLALVGTPGGGLTVRVALPRAAGHADDGAEEGAEDAVGGSGGPPAGTAEPGTRVERS
ncbi:sensor histidine kinase [Kocuria sp. M1R5S2]|uniref:sensor histidine kinase n=1 Tax=Kocuria rhizosphaerae TaxID=3376285 RepID=UPI0037BDCA71